MRMVLSMINLRILEHKCLLTEGQCVYNSPPWNRPFAGSTCTADNSSRKAFKIAAIGCHQRVTQRTLVSTGGCTVTAYNIHTYIPHDRTAFFSFFATPDSNPLDNRSTLRHKKK